MVDDQFGETLYLDKYTRYNEADLEALFLALKEDVRQAVNAGFSEVYVQFESTMDPYEDYEGPVMVQIRGDRVRNQAEIEERQEEERIVRLACDLDITFFEASTIDRLQKLGKIAKV
jgi:hypothetical protein